jgi:hypothetical protein
MMLAVCVLTSAVSFLHVLDETIADVRQHRQPIESSDMESNPLPSFCQHVNHKISNFKYINSTVLQLIKEKKSQLPHQKLPVVSQVIAYNSI